MVDFYKLYTVICCIIFKYFSIEGSPNATRTILENFSWKNILWVDEASYSSPTGCTDALTCVSRCETFYSETNSCACDKDCSLFGDCCMDYFLQCLSNKNDPLTNTDDITITSNQNRSMKNVLEEVLKMKFDSDHKGKQHCFNTAVKKESSTQSLNLQMVAECPRGSVQDDHAKCTGQSDTDPLMHVPLYDKFNKQIYKNIFCSKCHNRDTNHVELFGLELNCDHSSGDVAKNLWKQTGMGTFWSYVTQKCQLAYEFPKTFLSNPDLIKRYYCEPQNNTSCTFESSDENSVLCWLFRKPVVLTDKNSSEQFENIFCAGCSTHGFDGKNEAIQNVCSLSKTPIDNKYMVTSADSATKIKLSVSPGESVTLKYGHEVICKDGTFLDEETNVCKAIVCDFAKSDRECIKKFNIKQLLTDQVTNYAIVFQTTRNVSSRVTQKVIKLFSNAGILIENTIDCDTKELIGLQKSKFRACSMLVIDDSLSWESMALMDKAISVIWTSNNSRGLQGLQFSLIHTDVQKDTRFQCVAGKKVKRSAVILNESGTEFLYVFQTKLVYNLSNVPFMVDLVSLESNAEHVVDALVCESQILSCETKTINAKEYRSNNLRITLTKANIEIDQFSYVKLDNGKALICSYFLQAVEEEVIQNFPAADELKLAGGILSLFGCVSTFITYCLFPSLRNIPGKIVMNLCTALAIAQLVMTLGPFFTFNSLACKISGINKHMWWLSSFCWMNTFAYDLSKTFSNLSKMPAKVNEWKRIFMYCSYAWGLPVLYTTACVVVDYTDVEGGFHFGGSDDDFCWMQPRMAFILTFGIPLIVILTLNVIFFVRSVVGLCSAMKVARKAKKNSPHKSDAMNLLLYIRIASVMGFNWIFALLLGWIDEPALFYLHVICNSLQGVFIFSCFCINKRVWNMYKELIFSDRSMKRIQSDSSVAKTSTSTSNEDAHVSIPGELKPIPGVLVGTISVAFSTKSKGHDRDLGVTNTRV